MAENINKHDNKQYIAQLYQTNTVTNITNIQLRIIEIIEMFEGTHIPFLILQGDNVYQTFKFLSLGEERYVHERLEF